MHRPLRRFPPFRRFALNRAQRERKRRAQLRWEYIQSILITVGNIAIGWAGIELMLSHLIIWYHANGGARIRPDLPRMISMQLKYMKKLENDTQFSDDVINQLREIRLEIDRLNQMRNGMIHGVLHLINFPKMTWRTHSIKIDGESWRFITREYTNADIVQFSSDVSQLGSRMSPFIARLIGMPHPGVSVE